MTARARSPNRRTRFADHRGDELLRIASYNIHKGIGSDFRSDVSRIAQVLAELDCDTIGLQEVDNVAGARSESMQLEYLAKAAGMKSVAGATIVRHEGDYGNALLTRREILSVRRHDLSHGNREPRGALEVDIDVAGRPVRVIVTHLGLRPSERRKQVQLLVDLVRAAPADLPLVVLGDINEWLPGSRPLRWMHHALGRPPAQRSFPVWLPLFALDRAWVRPAESLLSFGVHRSAAARIASDHYPVRAVVAPRGIDASILAARPESARASAAP